MDKIPITRLDFSGNKLKYLKETLDFGWVVGGLMEVGITGEVPHVGPPLFFTRDRDTHVWNSRTN